jgi:penicillin-binding protein 1A
MAARLGIAGRFPNDASLALGTGEVTLIDLAAAYAAIANGGLRVTPFGIAGASAGGRGLPVVRAAPRRVLAAEPAAAMRRMLEAVVARGSGRAAALPGRAVAGKTGTTQDSRDAWFIGMVGGQVIGIWLGNDDARPMDDVRGGTLPARLFHEVAGALP